MRPNERSTRFLHPDKRTTGFARGLALCALAALALFVLTGCDRLPALAPGEVIPVATSVAQTVQAAVQPGGVPIGTSIAQTVAAAMPTAAQPTVAPPTAAPEQPTYTPYPTYTPLPTYTAQPTYTPLPTYPPPQEPLYNPPVYNPPPYYEPTPVLPYSDRPYVLRVWNRNQKYVMWIGTEMPYGGNFIKPNFYVEFYPPYATWMHIVYCRCDVGVEWPGWWGGKWYKNWNEHWLDNYNSSYLCSAKDVFVDRPFQEISVK